MALTPQFGSLTPSSTQQLLASNYLQFNTGAGEDFAQQYLPEIYEQEVERYGNRTLSGFLRMVGAEMPMTSDQVIWSEQNRLHISYDNVTVGADGSGAGATNLITIPNTARNVISINDTIVVLDPATGAEVKALVTASVNLAGGNTIDAAPFVGGAGLVAAGITAGAGIKIFVYGSAYVKGTKLTEATGKDAARVSVTPQLTQFSNSPIIIRDQYVISGSDMAQIGWVEVATEDGTSGYLWYLKAKHYSKEP